MFRVFMETFAPTAATTVLDVGVTSDRSFQESNYFERMYPYPHNVSCVGTEDGSHLPAQYPGLQYQQVIAGEPLPFPDGQFDIVFSNAVLEHVGSRSEQMRFLGEICRVGKAFFITTPNRWFPVEHHTGLPFIHYLPPSVFRGMIRNTRYKYWSEEAHLNILTAGQLRRLFPASVDVQVHRISFMGLPSNLIAFGSSNHNG
jgi:SAM-dependent methyltransferase